jgi:hypothetical protein
MCYIGERIRTVVVDPIQAPVPLPGQEPETEPQYVPEPAEVPEFEDEPELVPVYGKGL